MHLWGFRCRLNANAMQRLQSSRCSVQDNQACEAKPGASDTVRASTVGASTTMEQLTLGQISVLLKVSKRDLELRQCPTNSYCEKQLRQQRLQERADLMAQLQSVAQHSKHLEERVAYLEECLRTQGQTPDTSTRGSPEPRSW